MQAVNNISESIKSNSSKPIKFAQLQKLANQSMMNGVIVIEITKVYTVVFMEVRNSLNLRCKEKHVNWKNTEDGENIFFQTLGNKFRLTLKLVRCVKEQQRCLWSIFCHMEFMKR